MKKDDEIRRFRYDRGKGARSLARQRVGQPPSGKVITPKKFKRPKHKKQQHEGLEE